ncbi:hypothetical protein C7293_23715 [filamentous cyanobacterium CCT1]|nr:hypothetical protein C7293_23715 [filamentous cyanobacterium CCT1]PSN77986.1 hypothetical protein C8B47_19245 [filamentous cyanobacterium CCP4]
MRRLLARAPLRLVLVVPFVVQVAAAVGLTAWLSIRNGQQAVNQVTRQLRQETTARISHQVRDLLLTAQIVNNLSVEAIQRENLDLSNIRSVEDLYWDYINTFGTIQGLGLGNSSGHILAMFQRLEQGETRYVLEYFNAESQGKYVSLQLNSQRQIARSSTFDRAVDARERPWYKAAVAAKGPVWTDVYTSISAMEGHSLAINAAQPVYGNDGQLQGVASVILNLGQISQLLDAIAFSPSGQIYIIEANGDLVGSSDGDNPVVVNGERVSRLPAVESENELIRASAAYLNAALDGGFGSVNAPLQLNFKLDGERQFLQITPIQTDGLRWFVVVVAPESDFMEQIYANTRNTIWLCLGAFALATGVSIVTARRITNPLLQLNQAAKDIARGNLDRGKNRVVAISPHTREVGELADSFSQMTEQLQSSFGQLRNLNAELASSESRLKQFLDALPVGASVYDATGQMTYLNQVGKRLLGVRDIPNTGIEQLAEIFQVYRAGTRVPYPVAEMPIARSLQDKTTYIDDIELHRADRVIPLEVWGAPIVDEQGQVIFAIAAFQDISDRKATESALNRQRDFNQLVAEITSRFVDISPASLDIEIERALQDICQVTGVDTSFIFQFDETTQTLNLTHEWRQADCACESPLSERIPFSALPWTVARLRQRQILRVSRLAEVPAATDRASWRQFNVVAVLAVPLVQRSEVTGFMGFASGREALRWQDEIVQLIQVMGQTFANAQGSAQDELQLIMGEERLRIALKAANMGIWDWDIASDRLVWDDRMYELYGIRTDHSVAAYSAWEAGVHPEDLPHIQRVIQQTLISGKGFESEFRVVWPDGSIHHIEVSAVVQRGSGGQPQRMIGVNVDISDRKQVEAQLIHNALHDALTQLPNRSLLMNRLELAIQRAQQFNTDQFAVLFLDLDQFKIINDSLGHLVGDQLLVHLAHRLQSIIRPLDLAARLGGDEFVILLEAIADIQVAIQMAERILAQFEGTTLVDGHTIFVTTSIGIVWGTSAYTAASDLMRDADIALYRAKAQGRARYEVFNADMHIQAVKRMTLEQDLRLAIDQQQFTLHYQPIVDLNTRQVLGFEALVRWQHPVRGFVSPADFIPVAEETGLILPISRWVLEAACAQLATWQQQFPAAQNLRVSVNLSGKDLLQTTLVETIQQTLAQTQLQATSLTLEITESMLINDVETTIDRLRQLRALGISISIDDFGTGYSSLSYLYNLPANYLKIDQSFVGKMQLGDKNYKIVQAVVALSDQLQLAAIAEGIETDQQLQWLQALNCELGQGYWLSRPLTPAAATALLASGLTLPLG